jgi:hypothetical protein
MDTRTTDASDVKSGSHCMVLHAHNIQIDAKLTAPFAYGLNPFPQ